MSARLPAFSGTTTQSPAFREASPQKIGTGWPVPATPPMRPLRRKSRAVSGASTGIRSSS